MEFKSLKQKKKTKALPSDQRKTITKRMETIQQEAQPIESQLDLIDRLREYVYLRSLTATLVLFEHSEVDFLFYFYFIIIIIIYQLNYY